MTLELTPEQRQHIINSLTMQTMHGRDSTHRAAFSDTAAFNIARNYLGELTSLRDLIAKSSTVILHQP